VVDGHKHEIIMDEYHILILTVEDIMEEHVNCNNFLLILDNENSRQKLKSLSCDLLK
jgi:hypothetical protein